MKPVKKTYRNENPKRVPSLNKTLQLLEEQLERPLRSHIMYILQLVCIAELR